MAILMLVIYCTLYSVHYSVRVQRTFVVFYRTRVYTITYLLEISWVIDNWHQFDNLLANEMQCLL